MLPCINLVLRFMEHKIFSFDVLIHSLLNHREMSKKAKVIKR